MQDQSDNIEAALGYMKLIDEVRDTEGAQGVSVLAALCRRGWGESEKLKKKEKKKEPVVNLGSWRSPSSFF